MALHTSGGFRDADPVHQTAPTGPGDPEAQMSRAGAHGTGGEPPAQSEQAALSAGPASPAGSAEPAPAPGDDLGWDDQAWADAGGFEAVIGGAVSDALGGEGHGPIFLNFEIGSLDIDLFTFIQNTLVQNTEVVLDASDGGSLTVGGDVSAIGSQEALTDGGFGLF